MSVLLCVAALCVAAVGYSQSVPKNYSPTKWTVYGPYANETLSTPTADGVTRAGFDKEFDRLETGEPAVKGSEVTAGPDGTVDFAAIYLKDTDNKVAYARGVIESDKDQTLHASFGSDDAAKVWVNGKLVHRLWTAGRGIAPDNDQFTFAVHKGSNPILVKIDNLAGGWGFVLSLYDETGMKAVRWRQEAQNLGNREIVAQGDTPPYMIVGPEFPKLGWKDGLLLEPFVSTEPMKVRWFDADANEVTKAEKLGSYVALVEAKTTDGQPMRRLVLFCRIDPEVLQTMWSQQFAASPMPLGDEKPFWIPVTDADWKANRETFGRFAAMSTADRLLMDGRGAVLAAYLLDEHRPVLSKPMDLDIYGQEILLKVRRKIDGYSGTSLRSPKKRSTPAPVLRYGTAAEAGMKPDTTEKLRQMLKDWSREEGKPFSAVVARNGVVFLHEGFGELNGQPTPKDARFYPASIGKTLFGTVFAQFVDQGLVNPDDPIGKYLKDFPTTGDKALTFRNCLTHTSGIAGHATYGGIWNPTLDSAFSLRLPDLEPGVRFAYGGDGNNLASKALELISGVPVAKLMRQNLFDPLETTIVEPDLGFSSDATAWDIAKVAQVLANRGSYGDYEFFSEETFRKFLPTKLAPYMPRLGDKNLEWGYAVSWMPDPDGPREKGELGPNVIGHGSASSSIFRVDLDSGLVVVMGRYGVGNAAKYDEYRAKTMRLLREAVVR